MRQIIPSKRFDRDLRRMVRRGKDIAKLQALSQITENRKVETRKSLIF